MDVKIVNIKAGAAYDIYIGRANKFYNVECSKWHNPFVIGKDGNREEVITKFEEYVRGKPELIKDLPELQGKTLACYCDYPKENCHGGVLIKLLKEMDNEQIKNTQVIDNQGVIENSEQINTQIDEFIGSALLRYNKEQVYIFADLETEGLSLLKSRPWQISYAVFTIDKVIAAYNQYLWWDDLNVSPDAARITGFNYEEYKRVAQSPQEVLSQFETYYLDNKVTKLWHNGLGYDTMVWNTVRKALGLNPIFQPSLATIDTLSLARAYRLGVKPPKFDPINVNNNHDFLSWQFRMLSHRGKKLKTSLSAISKEFNIVIDESKLHTADYDIELGMSVFKQFLWKMEI